MDIYQSTYSYLDENAIQSSISKSFDVKKVSSIKNANDLIIFNHIGQSGGVQINDVVSRDSRTQGLNFLIPHFASYQNESLYENGRYFISGHFLNGVDEYLKSKKSTYFTILREPVSQIISFLTSKDDFYGQPMSVVWKSVLQKLDFWEKEVGHINLQTFEIATKYQEKRFKFTPENEETPIHFYKNYLQTSPEDLLCKAREKIANKYLMVGITELYEETLFLLYARMGLTKLSLWRPGIFSFWRPRRFEIPTFIVDRIKHLAMSDCALYSEYRSILEKDFFAADFGNEFTEYKLLSRNHEIKLYSEYSERIELGLTLSEINKDVARFQDEIAHVIEFRNAINRLIDGGLKSTWLIKLIKKLIILLEMKMLKKYKLRG